MQSVDRGHVGQHACGLRPVDRLVGAPAVHQILVPGPEENAMPMVMTNTTWTRDGEETRSDSVPHLKQNTWEAYLVSGSEQSYIAWMMPSSSV